MTVALNSLKNISTFLLLLLCLGTASAVHADDALFSSINTSQGLSDNQIRYILQLPDGRMVFTTSGNVNLYDGAHFGYLHRTAEDVYPLKQYDGFYRIYQSTDSLLWIKDTYKLTCVNLYKECYVAGLDSFFLSRNIHEPVEDLFVDALGHTWLLTSQGLQDQDSGTLIALPHRGLKKLQDVNAEDNTLYLFYNTGEVEVYDAASGQQLCSVAAYPASEQEDFGKTSLLVKGEKKFYQLRNGRKGGLFSFDWHSRTWEKIFEQNYALHTLIVLPGDEKAYISCVHGFWIIDLVQGTQQYVPTLKTKKGQLVSTEISTLFQDRQGGLWIGTFNRGLLYHHPAMHKLAHVSRNAYPIPLGKDVFVEAFAEDESGHIYLKVNSDVYKLTAGEDDSQTLVAVTASSLPTGVWDKLNPPTGNTVFRGKEYTALCTDTRGWTWAGTSDGLELFVPDAPAPRIFYREDGLSNNFVQAIIEDRQKDIWVTTSNGISRIRINTQSQDIDFINYNQQDGALEGEYMKDAAFEASDGTLYFGGVDGFNIFHPGSEPLTHGLPYAPLFTALRLYGEKVNTGERYGKRIILPQAAPYTTVIELDYDQNFLTFEFSALNYVNSERTYYRYMLEGIDKHWNQTTGQKSAVAGNGMLQAAYTNLPPGDYTFKVMASDNILEWNGETTKIHLLVNAPWWKTTTAYIVYTLLLILIVVSGIRFYVYWTRREMVRRHKEEILLLRIRNLIEQCNTYESERKVASEGKVGSSCDAVEDSSPDNNEPDGVESAFLARAIELVEKNLHVSGYSVEQLSRDLCMERTGLYRKLVTMLDQSPSLFIRNIRLQRAAQLLAEGELSIAEIAERTGFSSSSYLSKCFQEMYGCRPSEYAGRTQKST